MKLFLKILVFLPIISLGQTLQTTSKDDVESTKEHLDRKYQRELAREYPELSKLEYSIYHSFLFYVDQGYLDKNDSRISDIGFLNHLVPIREGRKRVLGMSTLVFSNGDVLYGENGKLYLLRDQKSNSNEKDLFEKLERLDVEIVFFISGLDISLRFGFSNERLFVFRQNNGKVEYFDFAEFKSCCPNDLLVQPIMD
jgi:hypothetical protein